MLTVQKMVVLKLPIRISKWVLDQIGQDINSHLYEHSIETGHQTLEISDYRIIASGYGNN